MVQHVAIKSIDRGNKNIYSEIGGAVFTLLMKLMFFTIYL